MTFMKFMLISFWLGHPVYQRRLLYYRYAIQESSSTMKYDKFESLLQDVIRFGAPSKDLLKLFMRLKYRLILLTELNIDADIR